MNIIQNIDFEKDFIDIKNNEIYYNDNKLYLQTCILSIDTISNDDISNKQIISFVNTKDKNNIKFINNIRWIEEKIKKYINNNSIKLTSCVKFENNQYYIINIKITEDTIFFNRLKNVISEKELFKGALCIYIISIGNVEYDDKTCSYTLNVIQGIMI